MNNKEFIAELSQREDFPLRDTKMLLKHLIDEISSELEDGNILTIPNFGTFEVKKRMERVVVNPSTGQRMLVPPRLALTFRASSALRGNTKKGGDA